MHDDFRVFLFVLWRHLKLPEPTKRQYAIAQYVATGPKRRMIQAWRGAAKTWITCAYALWRLYRNPNERIKIVSANEGKALENAVFIKRLIQEVPQLQFLQARAGQRDSIQAFDVGPSDAAVTPSVSCVGITGQLTGGRATILISDDVEVPKNSVTETMREKLAELIKEYDALVVPEGFDIIYLGTPQTEQSIYKKVRERGYDCRIWPVRYPEDPGKFEGALAPDILADLQADPSRVGRTVEPTRFTDLDLAEREASYGRSGFALQFMLDTSLADADRYPLKTADLIVTDVDDDDAPVKFAWASDPRLAYGEEMPNLGFAGDRMYRPLHTSETRREYQGRLLIVDPSGRGGDETAWVVLYMLEGQVFLKSWGGFRSGYDRQCLEGLAEVARRHRVNHILVESNFGDGMFSALLEPVLAANYPCTLEEVRASGQKERRIIDDLEPLLNQHRLIVDARAAKADMDACKGDEREQKYSLLYQLTRITKDRGCLRHDDRIDALAHGVRWFREALKVDAEKAEAEIRRAEDERRWGEWFNRRGAGTQTRSNATTHRLRR
ncbi:phage terminase large subunit [Stenotrophomonas oahuensis]|uniref:Phage terminase large subunit n=1 Tax=Stenotrophomonas oahuensis TaxID=3003271 RepID=A0ABY9YNV7_9GAMM|nr:phage terminase large subunit [Stenotrophomonas sp. A5586]WNH52417.1 phage terminase large subunit [Stenotrophomonas sp. A5586]